MTTPKKAHCPVDPAPNRSDKNPIAMAAAAPMIVPPQRSIDFFMDEAASNDGKKLTRVVVMKTDDASGKWYPSVPFG